MTGRVRSLAFSLVEVMIALVILSLALVAAVSLIGAGTAGVNEAEETGAVHNAAAGIVEVVSALDYGVSWDQPGSNEAANFGQALATVLAGGQPNPPLSGYTLWRLALSGKDVLVQVNDPKTDAPLKDVRLRVIKVSQADSEGVFPPDKATWTALDAATKASVIASLDQRSFCVVVEASDVGKASWEAPPLVSRLFTDTR